jgi:hypothetical protein
MAVVNRKKRLENDNHDVVIQDFQVQLESCYLFTSHTCNLNVTCNNNEISYLQNGRAFPDFHV